MHRNKIDYICIKYAINIAETNFQLMRWVDSFKVFASALESINNLYGWSDLDSTFVNLRLAAIVKNLSFHLRYLKLNYKEFDSYISNAGTIYQRLFPNTITKEKIENQISIEILSMRDISPRHYRYNQNNQGNTAILLKESNKLDCEFSFKIHMEYLREFEQKQIF